jgi:hypothetical protein
MKRDLHNAEQVYQCQGYPATNTTPARPCGQLHPGSTVAVRPGTETPYCDQCQSERLRLLTEVDAVDHGRKQQSV